MRAVPMKIESHLMTEKRRSLRGVWVVILVLLLAAAGAAVFFLASSDAQQRPAGRRGIDPTRPTPVVAAAARDRDGTSYPTGPGQEALVRQYEGTVKLDQGQIDNARLQLTYSRITAPISGRLGLRLVDPGNIVRAGDTNGLVVITQLQPVTAIFTIPQDNLPSVMQRLRSGERLPVEAYDREQKKKLASGTLASVDNQIDPATGTIKLRAQFPNEDASLFPNQFVNVRMLLDTRRGATLVPNAAVVRGGQRTFVYVIKEDRTVELRKVSVGVAEGDSLSIESGLASGELVVVEGSDRLRDGAKVEIPNRAAGVAPGERKAPAKAEGKRRRKEGA